MTHPSSPVTVPSPVAELLADPDAVLFDLDGVLTDTASLHMIAWAQLFTELFATLATQGREIAPYTDEDYYTYVDGKPRGDGIRALLTSRDIVLPDGDREPDEAGGDDGLTVTALAARKNAIFLDAVERGLVAVYPGSERLVTWLRSRDVPCAVVSSSRNARLVLAAAGLTDSFKLVVDGNTAEEHNLAGKPAPDMFGFGATHMGARPTHTVAVEDAISGVKSAAAAGLVVVAVDRGVGAAALTAAGATLVVDDLGDLIPPTSQ